jgi:hypothetical protein
MIPGKRSGQYLFILILAGLIAGLNILAPGHPSAAQRVLGSLIFFLGFIPLFVYLRQGSAQVPFLPFFGMIYSIYYALPVFILKKYSIAFTSAPLPALTWALFISATGLTILLISYYLIPDKLIQRFIPRVSIHWDVSRAKFWAVILGVAGLIFSYLSLIMAIPVRFAQIFLFLSELFIFAIGVLFILQLQKQLGNPGKIILNKMGNY